MPYSPQVKTLYKKFGRMYKAIELNQLVAFLNLEMLKVKTLIMRLSKPVLFIEDNITSFLSERILDLKRSNYDE